MLQENSLQERLKKEDAKKEFENKVQEAGREMIESLKKYGFTFEESKVVLKAIMGNLELLQYQTKVADATLFKDLK